MTQNAASAKALQVFTPETFKRQIRADRLILMAPNLIDAVRFVEAHIDALVDVATRIGLIEVDWTDREGAAQPFKIPPTLRLLSSRAQLEDDLYSLEHNSFPLREEAARPPLNPYGNDRVLFEFMEEQKRLGRSVCVCSQIDDKCLDQNELLLPSRAILRPIEWIGQNYRTYWRDSMGDYARLRRFLVEDRALTSFESERPTIKGFFYRLRRADGSMAEYSTDYYWFANHRGDPVRIGVSDLRDWRIVAPAATTSSESR